MPKGTKLLEHYINRIVEEKPRVLRVPVEHYVRLTAEVPLTFGLMVSEVREVPNLILRGVKVVSDHSLGLTSNRKTLADMWKSLNKTVRNEIIRALQEFDEEYGNIDMGRLPFVPIIRVYCAMCYHRPRAPVLDAMREVAEIRSTERQDVKDK